VLCVDVDQFTEINDVYGHSTGDRFLVEVGQEQRAFLAREGCQVQGYLIDRPEPIAHDRHLVAGLAGACGNIVGAR
jgi:hypothetical protein